MPSKKTGPSKVKKDDRTSQTPRGTTQTNKNDSSGSSSGSKPQSTSSKQQTPSSSGSAKQNVSLPTATQNLRNTTTQSILNNAAASAVKQDETVRTGINMAPPTNGRGFSDGRLSGTSAMTGKNTLSYTDSKGDKHTATAGGLGTMNPLEALQAAAYMRNSTNQTASELRNTASRMDDNSAGRQKLMDTAGFIRNLSQYDQKLPDEQRSTIVRMKNEWNEAQDYIGKLEQYKAQYAEYGLDTSEIDRAIEQAKAFQRQRHDIADLNRSYSGYTGGLSGDRFDKWNLSQEYTDVSSDNAHWSDTERAAAGNDTFDIDLYKQGGTDRYKWVDPTWELKEGMANEEAYSEQLRRMGDGYGADIYKKDVADTAVQQANPSSWDERVENMVSSAGNRVGGSLLSFGSLAAQAAENTIANSRGRYADLKAQQNEARRRLRNAQNSGNEAEIKKWQAEIDRYEKLMYGVPIYNEAGDAINQEWRDIPVKAYADDPGTSKKGHDMLEKSREQLMLAKRGLGGYGQFAMETAGVGLENIPTMALYALNPVAGAAYMAATVLGEKGDEFSRDEFGNVEYSAQEALLKAAPYAAVETASEAIGDSAILGFINKRGSLGLGGIAARSFLTEGAEEGAAGILDYGLDYWYGNPEVRSYTAGKVLGDAAKEALQGGIIGGIMGAGGAVLANSVGSSQENIDPDWWKNVDTSPVQNYTDRFRTNGMIPGNADYIEMMQYLQEQEERRNAEAPVRYDPRTWGQYMNILVDMYREGGITDKEWRKIAYDDDLVSMIEDTAERKMAPGSRVAWIQKTIGDLANIQAEYNNGRTIERSGRYAPVRNASNESMDAAGDVLRNATTGKKGGIRKNGKADELISKVRGVLDVSDIENRASALAETESTEKGASIVSMVDRAEKPASLRMEEENEVSDPVDIRRMVKPVKADESSVDGDIIDYEYTDADVPAENEGDTRTADDMAEDTYEGMSDEEIADVINLTRREQIDAGDPAVDEIENAEDIIRNALPEMDETTENEVMNIISGMEAEAQRDGIPWSRTDIEKLAKRVYDDIVRNRENESKETQSVSEKQEKSSEGSARASLESAIRAAHEGITDEQISEVMGYVSEDMLNRKPTEDIVKMLEPGINGVIAAAKTETESVPETQEDNKEPETQEHEPVRKVKKPGPFMEQTERLVPQFIGRHFKSMSTSVREAISGIYEEVLYEYDDMLKKGVVNWETIEKRLGDISREISKIQKSETNDPRIQAIHKYMRDNFLSLTESDMKDFADLDEIRSTYRDSKRLRIREADYTRDSSGNKVYKKGISTDKKGGRTPNLDAYWEELVQGFNDIPVVSRYAALVEKNQAGQIEAIIAINDAVWSAKDNYVSADTILSSLVEDYVSSSAYIEKFGDRYGYQDNDELPFDKVSENPKKPKQKKQPKVENKQKEPEQQNGPGLVVDDYVSANVSRAEQKRLDESAKALGITVRFADEVNGGESNAQYENGVVTIEKNNPNPTLFLYGHEITHHLEDTAPDAHKRLKNYLKNQSDYRKRLADMKELYSSRGYQVTDDYIENEVVADMTGDLINNEDILRKFIKANRKNQTFLQKLFSAFRSLMAKLGGTGRSRDVAKACRLIEDAIDASVKSNIAESGTSRYSIKEIVGRKKFYGEGVLLDTNLFDGVKPREWGSILTEYVYRNFAGTSIDVYDESGASSKIYFAGINDRVKKDGAKNNHKVIDKLARKTGDNIRTLSIVHLPEALISSQKEKTSTEHTHQWMDENGWMFRTVYIMDLNGNIYSATLNIANGRDRMILYDVNQIKKVDVGDVPSTVSRSGSHTNHRPANTIHRNQDKSKRKKPENGRYSLKTMQQTDVEYMEAVESGDMETAQRMVDEKANAALNAILLPDDSDETGFRYHRGPAPVKTFKRYAVFNVSEDGFRAAYAGNENATPVGVWLDAQNLQSYLSDITQFKDGTFASYIPGDTGTSFKSKFSPALMERMVEEDGLPKGQRFLLERGGKHSSDWPNFSQMNLKQDENGNKVRSAKEGALPHNKLIFEIEYGVTEGGDLTDYVREHGRIDAMGRNQGLAKIGPNQFYDFKTNPNAVGNWGLGGTFRIIRLVPYSEVVSKTEELRERDVQAAKDAYDRGEITKADMTKRIKSLQGIVTQKWVGGYHPEDFGLSVEKVDDMVARGRKMKLPDAVTYDDEGNVIPLSERFNPEVEDIRYSLKTSQYKQWGVTDREVTRNPDNTQTGKTITEIVDWVQTQMGVQVTTGQMRGNPKTVRGYYRPSDQAIRTRINNNLPTITHELGHWLDDMTSRKTGGKVGDFSNSLSEEARKELVENTDVVKRYQNEGERVHVSEGFAEFIREFLKSKASAQAKFPTVYKELYNSLDARQMQQIDYLADMVNDYMTSPADLGNAIRRRNDRVDTRTKRQQTEDKLHRLYQTWVDSNHAIEILTRETGDRSPYIAATNAAYAAHRAGAIITRNMYSLDGTELVGPSLKHALEGAGMNMKDEKSAKREYDDFGTYLVAKHGPERIKKGIDRSGKGRVTADDRMNDIAFLEKTAAELEEKYPHFKDAAEALYQFQKDFLHEYAVGSGIISKKTADEWQNMWEHYVPFQRYMADGKGTDSSASRGFANQVSGIYRFKGSGRDIIHPVDSVIGFVTRMTTVAVMNDVMRQLTDSVVRNGLEARWMERVQTPEDVVKVSTEAFKKKVMKFINGQIDFESWEEDEIQEFEDGLMALDDEISKYMQGDPHGNVVSVYKNGKAEFWKVNDKLLLESLTSLQPKTLDGTLAMAATVTRFMTSNITGRNVVWSVMSNMPRDIVTALVFSKNHNPAEIIGGMLRNYGNFLAGEKSNNQFFDEFIAMGGGQVTSWNADIDNSANIQRQMGWLTDYSTADTSVLQKGGRKVKGVGVGFIAALDQISAAVESGPRFAEYESLRKQGVSPQDAFYAAMDVTTNFARHGKMSQGVNYLVPFFNASVQGIDKFSRWIRATDVEGSKADRQKASVGRALVWAGASMLIAAMIYGFNNRDDDNKKYYQMLSNYTKNNYFCISLGDGNFRTIPKPREIAVLESFFESAMEYAHGGNKDAFKDFYDYATEQLTPPAVSPVLQGIDVNAFLSDFGMFGALSAINGNKDFLGNPIESRSFESSNTPINERMNSKTSVMAKWFADIVAASNLPSGIKENASPLKIDYFMKQVLGGFWKTPANIFPIGDEYKQENKAAFIASGLGRALLGNYTKDALYSNDLVNWMYDYKTEQARAGNADTGDFDADFNSKLAERYTDFYGRFYGLTKNASNSDEVRQLRKSVLDTMIQFKKQAESDMFPAYIEQLRQVAQDQSDKKVGDLLPQVFDKEIKDANGEKHLLTGSQYYELQTRYNGYYAEAVQQILANDEASANEKAAAIDSMKDDIAARARKEVLEMIGAPTSATKTSAAGNESTTYIDKFAQYYESGKISSGEMAGLRMTVNAQKSNYLPDHSTQDLSESFHKAKAIADYGLDLSVDETAELMRTFGINSEKVIAIYKEGTLDETVKAIDDGCAEVWAYYNASTGGN